MNRTPLSAASLAVASALLAACSGGGDAATTTEPAAETTVEPTAPAEASTTTAAPESTTTTEPPPTITTLPDIPRMPLTGEPIDDESEIPDRPALAVKLSNAPSGALPQAGLNRADIVFEKIINDQVTRLAAVFHSQGHDPVGPVRSGRFQDIDTLLSLNRPLFAWSGGNPSVNGAVRNSELVDLSALHSAGYYRRSGRRSPNDLYSDTDALWDQAPEGAEPPNKIFAYLRPGEELTGDPATEIEIALDSTRVRWEYDPESGRYFRWQDGSEHNTEDGTEVEQVWTDNVVVMMADYGRNPRDGTPEAQVRGSNPVYVFTGGTVRVGIWLRFVPEDPFAFFDNDTDLNAVGLQPGRTWVEVPRNIEGVLTWS